MQPVPVSVGERASPLLLLAHPGHELRLFHWMEIARPTLLLMTDGAGAAASSRTPHSAQCVEQAGARVGAMFGMATDREWYKAILSGDTSMFEEAVGAVMAGALAQRSRLIVTDAVDGYNPMHDLCEAVGAAAAARLCRRGFMVTHLVSRAVAGGDGEVAVELRPDAAAMRRKQAAIEAYATLAEEARRLIQDEPDALAIERLRHPTFAWPQHWSPHWEEVGRTRVAANRYADVIEYGAHVLPIARALFDAVDVEERRECVS